LGSAEIEVFEESEEPFHGEMRLLILHPLKSDLLVGHFEHLSAVVQKYALQIIDSLNAEAVAID